jgi:hypothetical protein
VDERGANVVKPSERVERDVAGSSDQDKPTQPARAVEAPGSPLPAEPVLDYDVPVLDADAEPVAVRNDNPGTSPSIGLAMRQAMP